MMLLFVEPQSNSSVCAGKESNQVAPHTLGHSGKYWLQRDVELHMYILTSSVCCLQCLACSLCSSAGFDRRLVQHLPQTVLVAQVCSLHSYIL